MCQQFYTMYISPGLREGNLFVGDSLLTVAAVLVCVQLFYTINISPWLRGGNRLAAALYSRWQ